MDVVSTLNLVSSQTEKAATACNLQTMTMNSSVNPHKKLVRFYREFAVS